LEQWQWIAGDLAFSGRGLQQRALSGIHTRFPIISAFPEEKLERRHRGKYTLIK
jgi:hypothetical protein